MNHWINFYLFVALLSTLILGGIGFGLYQQAISVPQNSVVIFDGKRYSAHVLIGVGRINKNRVPIYTVGFVPEESTKDAF